MEKVKGTEDLNEKYCLECGKAVKRSAVFCEHCGSRLKLTKKHKALQNKPRTEKKHIKPSPRSKAIAITLSILFGYWSWLYTFQKDKLKFWVFFGASMFFIILYMMSSCARLVLSIMDPASNTLGANIGLIIIISLIHLVSGLWALADSVRSPMSFYLNYPNEDRFAPQIKL